MRQERRESQHKMHGPLLRATLLYPAGASEESKKGISEPSVRGRKEEALSHWLLLPLVREGPTSINSSHFEVTHV